MLRPLDQFICDSCNTVVELPDGYLEWISAGHGQTQPGAHGWRVVHRASASPCDAPMNCYRYQNHKFRADASLSEYVGPDGVGRLLNFLGHCEPAGPGSTPQVRDLCALLDLIRRLTIPYFEEARGYLHQARADGLVGDPANYPYVPEDLRALIEHYRQD